MSEAARVDSLDEATLSRVEEVLREASGMTLASSVRRSLSTAMTRAAEARGMDIPTFLQKLLARDATVVEQFIEYAVIGETYFFRHPEHLRELGRVATLKEDGLLRVWSAGCATGEEAYSIAMTLLASGLPVERIRVTASDISARSLQRARAATYGPWSVRRIEPSMERRFLTPQGDLVMVSSQARRPVEFVRHNLVLDAAPVSEQDAVFCRNVLIYFPHELVRQVLAKLISALAPGGMLFLAPAEIPLTNGMGLEQIDVQGSPVLRLPRPRSAAEIAPAPPPTPDPKLELMRKLKSAASSQVSQARPTQPAAPAASSAPATPSSSAGTGSDDAMRQALRAAQEGKFDQAEELAREAARKLVPEAYLLLAMVAETRGNVNGAVDLVRKALYLDPTMALGHATLVTLYTRLNRREEAERARQNALRALDGLDDEHQLRGVESMTAGGLRQALAARNRTGWQGAR
ncbi:CheR family methyltransferase [Hyalangium sp.]|uniref:CheR family methyltransferase n=1 Tax=Hyalangium sp. TaxID=2028555 RepID=UPI002D524FB6|nr:CheR family methyltransferase [Hyalangium sp.]HYH96315.1 CheR family methyltransferase [Hyalangium sp.]